MNPVYVSPVEWGKERARAFPLISPLQMPLQILLCFVEYLTIIFVTVNYLFLIIPIICTINAFADGC